jgi:cysteine desulfurase
MLPYLDKAFGNPSSSHEFGQAAHAAVRTARTQVASLIGASTDEIVFTGGGSEASNLAIKGVAFAGSEAAGKHFITTAVEHPATLQPLEFLRRLGAEVTILPVDRFGRVDPEDIRRAVTSRTALITVMHSNNEVGTLQPIREVAAIGREQGILVHTDAAQSLGKLTVDVRDLGVELLTIAGHKLYAPKGIGALFARRGVALEPLIHGGGQESGRRAGTENVPYIVGLGMACEIANRSLPAATERLRQLRDRLWNRLHSSLADGVVLNGHPTERLPNTLNVSFVGQIGGEILAAIPEIAASTGSACHEGHVALSPVCTRWESIRKSAAAPCD